MRTLRRTIGLAVGGALRLATAAGAAAWSADPWSTPTNLGGAVNSSVNDLRPPLSWNGSVLYFGSVRAGGEGSQDIYVTRR